MEQTTRAARNGWRPEETEMLWKEIRAASETGASLRGVFERMGQTLGRKPNSVRNYYYMQLRDQAGDEFKRAAPFETFTDEEIHDLLRRVLIARGQGMSVRACVMELSGGDRTLMLRYQNKYRSVLRKKPVLVTKICRELREEGLPCPDVQTDEAPVPLLGTGENAWAEDPDAQAILSALASLVERAQTGPVQESDRLKVQRDLLLMQMEDLQSAAKAMIQDCKDFLGLPAEDQPGQLPLFRGALTGHIQRLERLTG